MHQLDVLETLENHVLNENLFQFHIAINPLPAKTDPEQELLYDSP